MKPCAILDVDGTIADVSSIRHYLLDDPRRRDFASFHAASSYVPAHADVVRVARGLDAAGITNIVLTSRRERWRYRTRVYLRRAGVPFYALGMRGEHDDRRDDDVKRDLHAQVLAMGFQPVIAVDDNPIVVQLWRSLDIPTVVVPGWDHDPVARRGLPT
jgi:hypothetical protein